MESLKCSCVFCCNCLLFGQINNAKRSIIISSSGRGVVSASGPQVLPGISSTWEWQAVPGNTWPQAATRSTAQYSATGQEKSEDPWRESS